jgi:chitinase domain-containing protein 1
MLPLLALLSLLYPNYTFHDSDVYAQGLVVENTTRQSILDNFDKCSNSRSSRYTSKKTEVLTFITPWNSIGYNLTIDFGFKFSTVVPVWFQVVDQGGYKIGGEQDILPSWLQQMRSNFPTTKIIPRVNFEVPVQNFVKNYNAIATVMATNLGRIVKDNNLDGLFLEFQPYFGVVEALQAIPAVISTLRKSLPRNARLLADIQSNDRYRYAGPHLTAVRNVIKALDAVFIAVYELPDPSLSPVVALDRLVTWAADQKVASKVIVGLPLFGFDFTAKGAAHVFASDVVAILRTRRPSVKWMKDWREHAILFNQDVSHRLSYPTLLFLDDRFKAIIGHKFGGFGFWELAQGMPYFFDLL